MAMVEVGLMKKKRKGTTRRRPRGLDWSKLTWADLEDWAGARAVSRGSSYQRRGRVHDLNVSTEGELVAWVVGGSRYATRVRWKGGGTGSSKLESSCSCPVGWQCKHAVAAVVALLDALENEEELERAGPDDVRWTLAERNPDVPTASEASSKPRSLKPFLRSLGKDELVDLVLEISELHPEIEADLAHRRVVSGDDAGRIVQQARAEIASAAQEAWSDGWTGEGELPDYSRVEGSFRSLLERRCYDEVVALGSELFETGQEQVGRAHDHGETAAAIGECMAIVFRALLRSSLSDSEKILYALDLSLADDYGLADGAGGVVEREWSKRAWSAVADDLARRLEPAPVTLTDFRSRYRRDRLSDCIVSALDSAGRADEADGVCEREAPRTGSYARLVRRLMDAKRFDNARQWAERGYVAVREEQRGTASQLRDLLRDIARRRRQWPLVAAYAAEQFFERPDVPKLKEVLVAAAKADCEEEVRAVALCFLETGRRPSSGRWPLPATGLPAADDPEAGRVAEHWHVLRDLATEERRPDDVLEWHDRLASRGRTRWRSEDADLRVAEAVASTHPDRAIEIYRAAAGRLIDQMKPDAYVSAGGLLRRVRDLLRASKRSREWPELLAGIRESHRRKRRLMEVLDGLDRRPIVSSRRGGGPRRRPRGPRRTRQ